MQTFKPMKKRLRFLLMVCIVVMLGLTGSRALAQAPQTIEVGPHAGATSYIGDLNVWRHLPQWDWKQLNQFHYDLGGVVRFNYDSRWSFRLDYTYLHARAADTITAWRPESHLNFKTTAHDLSLLVEFNFFDYYTGNNDKGFSPYIFGGISGLLYQVKPFTRDEVLDAIELKKGKTLSIPFGIGFKISISEHLAATAEWRMHYTFTDNFDDVSGDYPALGDHITVQDSQGNNYDLTDPTESFPADYQRGHARNNDWFGMLNLTLTWKFVVPDNAACKLTDH